MISNSISKAAKPNPALEPLRMLVGEWRTTGNHPMLPGVELHGHTSFNWIEGGAFLIMHSKIDHEIFPDGIAIFASDDSAKQLYMLYFDERGVSRKYMTSLENNIWKWWRDDPEFSQRFSFTISENGNIMTGKGEMSRNSAPWEEDLGLTSERIL